MKRAEFKREIAHAESVLEPVVDLLKTRLPSLVRDAVECEFSTDQSIAPSAFDAPPFKFESRALQETARGILSAVRERITLYVARAVAERLQAGDGEKWRAAKRARATRAQREFDEYKREHLERVARQARLARVRRGSIASPKRSAAAEALRARIAALRLPRVQ